MSLRDELLSKCDAAPVLEPVKFLGVDMFIREMDGFERDEYESEQYEASKQGKGLKNFRARLLVRVLVDEKGERVFQDGDADRLGKLPARKIRPAFDRAAEVNALTGEDQKELEKN